MLSILIHTDPLIARDYRESEPYLRNPIGENCQYQVFSGNCWCADHPRGQVLGGIWTRIMNEFVSEYPTTGLEMARKLHVDWMLITIGGHPTLCESAYDTTVIEVLTADDEDADLSNGTPNCSDIICPSFAAHSLPCSSLDCP